MRIGLFILLMMLMSAFEATAQTPGTCPRSQGEAYLDVGNVRARILNNGGLFYRGEPSVYEVPKGSGSHASYSTVIQVGGLINDSVRTAATLFGEWEFWAGPLDADGNPPDDCAPYDRLWEITRNDLITYAKTGTPTANMLEWPWHLGAPVIDGDGIAGNYDFEAGDRPALRGDQMLWWIMNDRGNEHVRSKSPPIGLEVHGSAFAFNRPSSLIGNTTFYRYKLINKNSAPLEDAYFGIFTSPDLGDFADDYVGCDTLLHLAFTYNADDFDGTGRGYGAAPPATGYTFLRTAVAEADHHDNDRDGLVDEPGEMRGMTSFMFNNGGSGVTGDAETGQDFYYYMQGRWKDGKPFTVGGANGRDFSDTPTHFFYPGDPVTRAFWSERNFDNRGTAISTGDRQFLTASGPFTLQPGKTLEIVFALVWSRGTDHLDSVRQLKKDVKRLHEVADEILAPDVTRQVSEPEPTPTPPPVLGFAQNYPNPFSGSTRIRYSLPRPMYVRLTVFDLLGRAVATLVDQQQQGGIHDVPFAARDLPGGVYVYRIEMDALRFTKTMMVLR